MKSLYKSAVLAVCVAVLPTPARTADVDATALIQRMQAAHRSRGSVIRAKLSVEESGSEQGSASQIVIKERQDDDVSHLLCQVMWPASRKGESLSVTRSKEGLTGFLLKPSGEARPLNAALLKEPYLDSDLTVEDIAEDFWAWPSPKYSGDDTIKGLLCQMVELRPLKDSNSSYSLIKAWISVERLLPIRLEKLDHAGQTKTFVVSKFIRQEKTWSPKLMIVQRSGSTRQTVIEISRGEMDVEIPLGEFSLEHLKKRK